MHAHTDRPTADEGVKTWSSASGGKNQKHTKADPSDQVKTVSVALSFRPIQ